MESKTEPIAIIDLLAFQEYKLSVLYNEYGNKFPEKSSLWNKLVKDELEHKKLIRGLYDIVKEGQLYFNAMVLKVSNIENHIKTIEKLIKNAQEDSNLTSEEAINTALKIENSMIDQGLFTYFSGDSKILKNALNQLTRGTEEHYNLLLEASNKNENKS